MTALEKGVNAPLVKFAIGLATLLACATVQAVPLAEALKSTSLLCRLSGDGRSQLTLQVENRSGAKESVEIAAGTIAMSSRYSFVRSIVNARN